MGPSRARVELEVRMEASDSIVPELSRHRIRDYVVQKILRQRLRTAGGSVQVLVNIELLT